MRLAILVVAAVASGQSMIEHGAEVFARTCASGYCHGPNGVGGGAPKLAGRGFDEAQILSITRAGIEGTEMRGYGTVLTRPDFNAVVGYVASLNGIAPRATGTETKPRVLSAAAARGRDLFSDSVRGVARCSTCHEADGLGIAVATMGAIPANAAALRDFKSKDIRVADAEGDRFPALVVSRGGRRMVVYDLTTLPPVLRTLDANLVKIGEAAKWRHPVAAYTDAEIELILEFLRAVREK